MWQLMSWKAIFPLPARLQTFSKQFTPWLLTFRTDWLGREGGGGSEEQFDDQLSHFYFKKKMEQANTDTFQAAPLPCLCGKRRCFRRTHYAFYQGWLRVSDSTMLTWFCLSSLIQVSFKHLLTMKKFQLAWNDDVKQKPFDPSVPILRCVQLPLARTQISVI